MAEPIEVDIVLPADTPSEQGAVYVYLEDITEADAAARQLSKTVLRSVRLAPGRTLSVNVDVPEQEVKPGGYYCVRVHVDIDGDQKVSPGDLISTQSHPVLTPGRPRQVRVPVKRIA